MSYTKAPDWLLLLCGIKTRPLERPCITCGKPKQHNNAFCSAGCKLVYDMQHKQAEGGE